MGRKPRKHKSDMQKTYRYKPQKRKSKSKKPIILILALCLIVAVVVIYSMVSQSGISSNKVLLRTSRGDITIQLYDDMPITTENFKKLVQQGTYDGTIFHRVVQENIFVIQGGDASVKGINVPTIPDELPNRHSNSRGWVAMAKTSEPNSANSQFYINLKDNLDLDDNYSVFGRVIAGMDVVDNIGKVETDENDRPLQDVIIIKAEFIS